MAGEGSRKSGSWIVGAFRNDFRKLAIAGVKWIVSRAPWLKEEYGRYPVVSNVLTRLAAAWLESRPDPRSPGVEVLKDVAEGVIAETPDIISGKESVGDGASDVDPRITVGGVVFLAEDEMYADRIEKFWKWFTKLATSQQIVVGAIVKQYRQKQDAIKLLLKQSVGSWNAMVPEATDADFAAQARRWRKTAAIMIAQADALYASAEAIRPANRVLAAENDIDGDLKKDAAGKLLHAAEELEKSIGVSEKKGSFAEDFPRTTAFLKEFGERVAQPRPKKFGWFDRQLMRLGGLRIDKNGRRILHGDRGSVAGWFSRVGRRDTGRPGR